MFPFGSSSLALPLSLSFSIMKSMKLNLQSPSFVSEIHFLFKLDWWNKVPRHRMAISWERKQPQKNRCKVSSRQLFRNENGETFIRKWYFGVPCNTFPFLPYRMSHFYDFYIFLFSIFSAFGDTVLTVH